MMLKYVLVIMLIFEIHLLIHLVHWEIDVHFVMIHFLHSILTLLPMDIEIKAKELFANIGYVDYAKKVTIAITYMNMI